MAPAVAFGVAAAQLAATDSGLAFGAIDPVRLGAFVGSRGHSSDRQDLLPAVRRATEAGTFRLDKFGAEGLPLVHPMWLLKGLANNVLYFVSLKLQRAGHEQQHLDGRRGGHDGHRRSLSHHSTRLRRRGDCRRIRFGARPGSHRDVRVIRPGHHVRPILRTRAGHSIGGATALSRRKAQRSSFWKRWSRPRPGRKNLRRSARLRLRRPGRVDPQRPSGRHARGFSRALSAALADAGGVIPDAVFTHGLATRASDIEETQALKAVFGARRPRFPRPR